MGRTLSSTNRPAYGRVISRLVYFFQLRVRTSRRLEQTESAALATAGSTSFIR